MKDNNVGCEHCDLVWMVNALEMSQIPGKPGAHARYCPPHAAGNNICGQQSTEDYDGGNSGQAYFLGRARLPA